MEALRSALRGEPGITLDVAALEMASIERPGLDVSFYVDVLDRVAAELAAHLPSPCGGFEFIQIANSYLFEEQAFRGNDSEYYDPRNSCLNEVLDRKQGIPITLSVVYMEVARRLGRPVFGIGLPGHFVVEYDDGAFSAYVDPFHAGKLLREDECLELAREITGVDFSSEKTVLERVSVRYILARMLNNMRSAYFRLEQYRKGIAVLDLLIEAFADNGEYYKARGVARLKIRELSAAKRDFEKYLEHSPQADDRAAVKKQLEAIHRWLGRLN